MYEVPVTALGARSRRDLRPRGCPSPRTGSARRKDSPTMSKRNSRRAVVAMLIASAAFAPPSAASAGSLEDQAPSCDSQVLGQTFLPWGDIASYTLNPGGSFERGARGW